MIPQNTKDILEIVIDNQGLENLVDALAQICFEKADHVNENWQDRTLANQWQKRGLVLQRVAAKIENLDVGVRAYSRKN